MRKDANSFKSEFQPQDNFRRNSLGLLLSRFNDSASGKVDSDLEPVVRMSRSVRSTPGFANSFRRRAICQCASSFSTRTLLPRSTRSLTTSSARRDEEERYGNRGRELRTGPRWQSTPPRMIAPFRSKPRVLDNDFFVNEDPDRLDDVYDRVLGGKGCRMLTDEVKWLAVTHKSFDHGRRGFNDRLAFLGTKAQGHPYNHR